MSMPLPDQTPMFKKCPKRVKIVPGKMASLCTQTGHFYIINRHAKFVTAFIFHCVQLLLTQTEHFLTFYAPFM